MSSTQTTSTAFSGEIPLVPDSGINIDVFGLGEIPLTVMPTLWEGEMGPTYSLSLDFPLVSQEVTVVENAEPGWYYLRCRGAYKVFGEDILSLWTPYQVGWWNTSREGSPIRGGVIRLAEDPLLQVRLPERGFREIGFVDAASAESASFGQARKFWHPGGRIEFIMDDPYADEVTGALQVSVTKGSSIGDQQGWQYIMSSLPKAANPAYIEERDGVPTLVNVVPGWYIFHFWVHDPVANERVTQRITIHVWETVPRRGTVEGKGRQALDRDTEREIKFTDSGRDVLLEPNRFPYKPPMRITDQSPKNPPTDLDPAPRYSGQLSQRPEETKQTRWKKPKRLGGREEY